MTTKYTIGLDIGTNSVGWAVIDDSFKLAQAKKRINNNGVTEKRKTNLWGARLFDEGNVAEDTRTARGARRRYRRRHERLNYLRGIFHDEISQVDECFFIRLNESFYLLDDKTKKSYQYRDNQGYLQTKEVQNKEVVKYPLFKTQEEETAYYDNYPTIYHLRKHLMESQEKADIREIYLAMHHILKYRGHFTNQGQKFNLNNMDIATSLTQTLTSFENATNFTFGLDEIDQAQANEILGNPKLSKAKKAYDLNELYKIDADILYRSGNEAFTESFEKKTTGQQKKFIDSKQKQLKALFTAIVGNKINLKDIFENPQYTNKENENFPKDLYFHNEDFDTNINNLEVFLEPEEIDVLIQAKKVYESIILSSILNGHSSLSAAMIEKYETHKKQLIELKTFTKSISDALYNSFFKKDGIYSNYIDGTGKHKLEKTNLEDFYKAIKKSFEKEFSIKFPDTDKEFDFSEDIDSRIQQFLITINNEMQFETYLPKQRMFKNGAIPYQIHENELVKIIENQKVFYPFLGEKVEIYTEEATQSEKNTEYKIQTLMKFRIPYYVGPLTEATQGEAGKKQSEKSRFAWMQKISDQKITPWNFEQVVDKEGSAVEFIERMTSFCTYLPEEKVLPKHSLVYQEFIVYNELISSGYYEKDFTGEIKKNFFSAGLRKDLVEDLFKENKKVTAEQVLSYLNNSKNITATEIFGIDRRTLDGKPSFNGSLSTFIDLKNSGISLEQIEAHKDKFEQIIKWQTIFEDKKILLKTIKNANKDWNFLTDEQIKKLAARHYTGFGNLSNQLINGIRDKKTGLTILEQLKQKGYNNFMRLISGATADNYSYKEEIEQIQTKEMDYQKLSYSLVEKLPGSPAIKKGIWQSLKIVEELEKILGKDQISRIVIEMSRENATGRTQTRYKQLKKMYDQFQERNKDVYQELKGYEKNEKALDQEKLYLYFTQNGRCAYTGTPLNISELLDYEVDHIIPQSFLKDDSLENKVLVTKWANQQKGGDVPSQAVINDMKSFWEILVKANLIGQKKLKSLTIGKLTDKVKEGFINRQLVENRQITKHVATILAKYFDETDTVILTPKSALTSQFRKGIIYLPNPDFDEQKAHDKSVDYKEKRLKEVKLHKGFPKNREINDYHHAHDAYLNAVVANYLYLTKPELKNAWVYGNYERNSSEVFGKWAQARKNKSMQLLSDMLEDVWVAKETGEIIAYRDEVLTEVEKTLNYRIVNIVKKTEVQIGKFGDESTYKKDIDAKNFSNGLKSDLPPNFYGGTKSPISAFTVVVRNKKGAIIPLSVSAMVADNYLKSEDKLTFIQTQYPDKKIEEIVVEKVAKYTKFENNNVVRLLASADEAQKADALTFTQQEMSLLEEADSDLVVLFDKISAYLRKNMVYGEANLLKWEGKIKVEFIEMAWKDQAQFIKDAFSITKTGTTNAKGKVKGKIGKATGQQQHTSKAVDIIQNNSTLIYQSITGLFETRKTLL